MREKQQRDAREKNYKCAAEIIIYARMVSSNYEFILASTSNKHDRDRHRKRERGRSASQNGAGKKMVKKEKKAGASEDEGNFLLAFALAN